MGRSMSLLARGVASVLLLAACGSDDAAGVTEVIVRFDAQPCTAASARAARVRVLDNDGAVVLDLERSLVPGAPDAVSLPLRVPVLPRDGDATRRFIVEGVLLDEAGAPLATTRVSSHFVAGRAGEILACFMDACARVDCGRCDPAADAGACATCEPATAVCTSPVAEPVSLGSAPAACPAPPAESSACNDGRDQDCDGLVDCSDPDCCGDAACAETTMARCANGIDDDCDALSDCRDPDCCAVCPQETPCGAYPNDGGRCCGSECRNVLTTDPANCGTCDFACADRPDGRGQFRCWDGACGCNPTLAPRCPEGRTCQTQPDGGSLCVLP